MNTHQMQIVATIKETVKSSHFGKRQKPRKYDVVIHEGSASQSKRVGWCGMVMSHPTDPLVVHWFCSSGLTTLSEVIPQQYTDKWAEANLRYKAPLHLSATGTKYIFLCRDVENHLASMQLPLTLSSGVVVKSKSGEGSFILWSMYGTRDPKKIHTSYQEAVDVAKEMSTKHGQEFFVCKLVSSVLTSVMKSVHTEVKALC